MSRLPAHLEAAAMIRQAQAEGGFAAVLRKGDREAGTILVVVLTNGANPQLFERMPALDGAREWTRTRSQDADKADEFDAYLARRIAQDGDLWLIELDVPNPERLIGVAGTPI